MKISELVKTYKLLSDPSAPDWNVKFVGGVVVALAVIAAAGAIVYNATQDDADAAPAAAVAPADEPPACDAEALATYLAANPDRPPAKGDVLPSGCRVA